MTEVINHERQFKYESPRLVTYWGSYNTISEQVKPKDEISYLLLDDEEIKPKVLTIGKKIFKCNRIFVDSHNNLHKFIKLSMYYSIINKTTIYLLPTLFDIHQVKIGKKALLYEKNFVNSFIQVDQNGIDYRIYLLYRYDGSVDMGNLEEWFKKLDNYKGVTQPDKYHTLYCFEVEDKENYDVFLSSNFAKFTAEHKLKIERFHGLSPESEKYKIIHNSDDLRLKMERDLRVTIPKDVSLNEEINLEVENYNATEMIVEKSSI